MTADRDRLPLVALAAGAALALLLAFTLRLPQRLVALAWPATSAPRLDGRVTPGEYQFHWADPASKLTFDWSIAGDRLIGAISSPDTGWVAIGFGGDGPMMYGADIVIGYVDARGAHVEDDFANTPVSHVADTTLGGHDDILASAGLSTAAGTTIEFERPLTAHDSTDQPIKAGQTRVLMASADAKDFVSYHAGGHKAVTLLDLFAGPPAAAAGGGLLPDHLTDVQIMVGIWMAILLIIGIHGVVARWAEGPEGGPGSGERTGVAAALIAVFMVVELASLATFAVAVARAGPVWLLGSSLALGMFALAAIVVLYSRAFVRWETTRAERDDGIPW